MSPAPLPRPEIARQLIHFTAGLPAFLLPFLPRWIAAALAAAGVAANLWLLPRLPWTREIFRRGERRLGGIVLYPATILGMLLLLPEGAYPRVAAAAWGILAAGDSASGIAGPLLGARKLPWNPKKSWWGSFAFLIAATGWSWLLLLWCGVGTVEALSLAFWGSLAGAIVESLPIPIDDNISVIAAAAGALLLASGGSP